MVETYRTAIFPALLSVVDRTMPSWTAEQVHKRYSLSPKESGVTAIPSQDKSSYKKQVQSMYHLKGMIGHIVRDCNKSDVLKRKKGRFAGDNSPALTETDVLDVLIAQEGRCALSGIRIPFEKVDWRAMSVDRVDDSKPHTRDNIRIICRVFQTRHKITSRTLFECLATQRQVELTTEQRERLNVLLLR